MISIQHIILYMALVIQVFELNSCLCSSHHFRCGRRSYGNLGEPSSTRDGYNLLDLPADQYVQQKLDHFDQINTKSWKQRYFVNTTHYSHGKGAVFLFLSGEGTANPKWMAQGAWSHYAKAHKALMFLLEHRFYGKSQPTEDLSTDNLYYLTSEQAIEDAAFFIVAMNKKYHIPTPLKWFVFGGSYSGSLATWLRMKHPSLVHATIAGSGPLKAQMNFPEYLQIVERSIAASKYGDDCVDAMTQAFAQVKKLTESLEGQQILNEKLILCDPIQTGVANLKDMSNLYQVLSGQISFVVQYNNTVSVNTNEICAIMVNTTLGSPIDRLANVNLLVMDIQQVPCLDYKYDAFLTTTKNTFWNSTVADTGLRQWTFQTCNEFGFYQTSDKTKCIFGNNFPVDFFVQECTDLFGPHFNKTSLNKAIRLTNNNYGSLNPNTTNVFTTQGKVDPWHALGLTHSRNENMPVVYLEGCSHCSDMYEPNDTDLPQLKDVRSKINEWIGFEIFKVNRI